MVVGAGFAGVATALALARDGVTDVLVLEAESGPGHHASGRNAAMARRVVADPLLAQLATESLELLREHELNRGQTLLRPVGGLLIGDSADCHRLLRAAEAVEGLRDEVRALEGADLVTLVPALRGATSTAAVYSPGCGVVDIHGLLSGLIEEARSLGVQFEFGVEVHGVDVQAGRTQGVLTKRGPIASGEIVNAAGHRAGALGAMAGAKSAALHPSRRHLYVTSSRSSLDSGAPYVWDVTQGFYFRPEGDGLLLCACDETAWGEHEVVVEPGHRSALAAKLLDHVPELADTQPGRSWVGLRTKTPDGRFVLGRDPQVEGFTWAAGLGGHGMTTSLRVGELVASAVIDGEIPQPYADAMRPGRRAPVTER